MKIVTQLKKKDLVDKKVLVRIDCNVPIKSGKVVDSSRLDANLETIGYLLENGARVILVGHLGSDGQKSLTPVAKYLRNFFGVRLIKELDDPKLNTYLDAGQVVLLENIRKFEGEKKDDPAFAKRLAKLADIYVNDAFSVSHRAHASVSAITKYLPSYAGLLFMTEFKNLSLALKPKKPLIVILGGIKFQTKIPLIKKFSKTADKIFITGALANSFMKAMGCDVGNSIVDEDVSYIKPFLKEVEKPVRSNGRIVLPVDFIENKKKQIVDIGPETLKQIKKETKSARMIIWNGPAGWFEVGAKQGTLELAKIVSQSKAKTIVGGGDTLSAIQELKLDKKFTHLSLAGGAMLDFLASGTLPGIKALK
ncbi:MAG TPA: phosphoglycerate kinase [Candidatus Paceibacterota bacterium]|nr:phosphoglycerate kinase [Candidatus Paceibacterota bacterium]